MNWCFKQSSQNEALVEGFSGLFCNRFRFSRATILFDSARKHRNISFLSFLCKFINLCNAYRIAGLCRIYENMAWILWTLLRTLCWLLLLSECVTDLVKWKMKVFLGSFRCMDFTFRMPSSLFINIFCFEYFKDFFGGSMSCWTAAT